MPVRNRLRSTMLRKAFTTNSKVLDSVRNDPILTRRLDSEAQRAYQNTSEHLYGKLTTQQNGVVSIEERPPLLFHPAYDLVADAQEFMTRYSKSLREDHCTLLRRFRAVDAAIKVVGVGSVGTRCFVVLMLDERDRPLFLQVKEARRSVLEDFSTDSQWLNNGERVVAGQRLLQAVSDIFWGWSSSPTGRDYYVRQLRDMKMTANLDTFNASALARYGRLCGATLARAHAKAGGSARIAGYLGTNDAFDLAIGKYAVAYADRVERDYDVFRAAARRGEIPTEVPDSLTETKID
jgi:uncharacterized protein (DUF2252 family)